MSGQTELQVKIYLDLLEQVLLFSEVATDENGCSVSIEVEITESDGDGYFRNSF